MALPELTKKVREWKRYHKRIGSRMTKEYAKLSLACGNVALSSIRNWHEGKKCKSLLIEHAALEYITKDLEG